MKAPLVSVVVNNYNYERFLGEAIESVLAQSYPQTEVVVVDDGSTDGSRGIIAGYGGRVRPVLKENGGQASAFNVGFAASRGEIVIFLDADDYLFPEAVERVVAAWEPGISKVHYRLQMVDASGHPVGFKPPRDLPLGSGDVLPTLLEKGNYRTSVTSGNAFSREILEHILPMPEDEFRITADGYLNIQVPFHGKIVAIEEPLGTYRIHGSNQWASGPEISSDRFLRLLQYDLKKQALLTRKSEEVGRKVPRDLGMRDHGNLQRRMALSRLDPSKNPYATDRPGSLVYWGLRAVWRFSGLGLRRRLIMSAWFLWVGLSPLTAARPAVTWLFARQSRPRVADWVRGRVGV